MSKRHGLKSTFYQETKNILYLEEKMEDALYSAPHFTIEQEEGEIFRYKKTRISFRPQHSSIASTWITPEIDSVNFLGLTSSTKYLFNCLKERGYSSFYIDRFAECEKHEVALKGEGLQNILLQRITTKKVVNGQILYEYQYHLNGGNLYFHHILEKDPNFWLELVRASEETELLQFSQLHLAADCEDNLMENVTQSIKFGHYESNGLNPRAYFVLDGVKKERAVGKYSNLYKELKKKEFTIQTLYFGDKRRQPVSIALNL